MAVTRHRSRFLRRLGLGVSVGFVSAVLAWLLTLLPAVGMSESWLQDWLLIRRSPRDSSTKIVLIAFDEDSFRELGKFSPYLSPELADVLEFLHQNQAQAVGVDLVVPEYVGDLPGIRRPISDAEEDVMFLGDPRTVMQVVREHRNTVFIQRIITGQTVRPLSEWYLPLRTTADDVNAAHKSNASSSLPGYLSCVELSEDPDHIVRSQQLLYPVKEAGDRTGVWPHFALALIAAADEKPIHLDEQGRLTLGSEPIAHDDDDGFKLAINYLGPPGTIPMIPVRDILLKKTTDAQRDLVNGSIAIIGVTADSMDDFFLTPYSNRMPLFKSGSTAPRMAGIELHANIIATLRDQAAPKTLNLPARFAVLLAIGFALGCGYAWLGFWKGFLIACLTIPAWQLFSIQVFARTYLQMPQAGLLLLVAVSVFGPLYLRFRWTRRLLGAVKSRQIAHALEANEELFSLQGEERIVTIMFSDIRNFSAFSRVHSPQEVTRLLNSYFSAIVPIIEKHGGVVNQYMGDGIMVMFNAPYPLDDHALASVKSAIDMVKQTHAMRETWIKLGHPEMRIGVGINSGLAVVGVIGSATRLDYTAIGDSVNAAARIEAENKSQGTEILISESTWKLLPHQQRKFLGVSQESKTLTVKGVGEVKVFSIDPALDPGLAPVNNG